MNIKRKSYRIVLTILFSIVIFLVAKTSHGCTSESECVDAKCKSGVCTKYITDCDGDDQNAAGLIATYSDGSKSSRIYSTCVSSGGTPNVAYGPPEGVITTYSCHKDDFDVNSNTSDCGTRNSRLCDGSYVTYYSHCNYSEPRNYWKSTHAYCNWLPGDCNSSTAPSLTLSANPTTITLGGSTTIRYTVGNNATSCTASVTPGGGAWLRGKESANGTYSEGVTPTTAGTKIYTLTCSNAGGTRTRTAEVIVNPSYSCTGGPIPSGSTMCTGDNTGLTATLAWQYVGTSSSNCTTARKCQYYTTPPSVAAPSLTLSANPTTITLGGSTTISYTVGNNATSCTASVTPGGGAWLRGKESINGTHNQVVTPTTAGTKIYTLTCLNAGGTRTRTAEVIVYSCTGGPIPSGSTMCTGDNTGLTATLVWQYVGTSSSSCTTDRKCQYYTTPPCDPDCPGAIAKTCKGQNAINKCNGTFCGLGTRDCDWQEVRP